MGTRARQRGSGHPAVVVEAINGRSPGGLGISWDGGWKLLTGAETERPNLNGPPRGLAQHSKQEKHSQNCPTVHSGRLSIHNC